MSNKKTLSQKEKELHKLKELLPKTSFHHREKGKTALNHNRQRGYYHRIGW